MEEIINFKICPDYNRVSYDFSEIQRDRNNPLDSKGYPLYPFVLPSSDGSSYTYKINARKFFKRKLQDGDRPGVVFSMHHDNKTYNELKGSFDDLAEVLCYILAKNIKTPETNKSIIDVAEYELATYLDKDGHLLRGCVTENVCKNESDKLVCMAEMLKNTDQKGNTINVYMDALEKYCSLKRIKFDSAQIRHDLVKNSYFCWKVGNSDNHKNNITFIASKNPDGTTSLTVSPLLDNGSAYELSSPFTTSSATGDRPRIENWLKEDDFGKIDENGNRVFSFLHYPQMHTAFQLDVDSLLFNTTKINGKQYSYEYALASEMLSDKKLFNEIYQVEKQFDIDSAIHEIDETYGSKIKDTPKTINWPPLLKEFIKETNSYKSRTLAYVIADYYCHTAYTSCFGNIDRENPTEGYNTVREIMLNVPLQENKECYDEIFLSIATHFGAQIDKDKLSNLKFKKESEFDKQENQPS